MTWLTFGIKQYENGRLSAILNFIHLTQVMQNHWTMNIKQNVMSHTTHDKFHTKKSKMAASWPLKKKKIHYIGNLAW